MAHRLSSCGSWAQYLWPRGLVPDQGSDLQGGCLTTAGPPGGHSHSFLYFELQPSHWRLSFSLTLLLHHFFPSCHVSVILTALWFFIKPGSFPSQALCTYCLHLESCPLSLQSAFNINLNTTEAFPNYPTLLALSLFPPLFTVISGHFFNNPIV